MIGRGYAARMDTRPAAGDRVRYVADERTFVVAADDGDERTFGGRLAVPAHLDGEPDGEQFRLLVEHCTPAEPAAVQEATP